MKFSVTKTSKEHNHLPGCWHRRFRGWTQIQWFHRGALLKSFQWLRLSKEHKHLPGCWHRRFGGWRHIQWFCRGASLALSCSSVEPWGQWAHEWTCKCTQLLYSVSARRKQCQIHEHQVYEWTCKCMQLLCSVYARRICVNYTSTKSCPKDFSFFFQSTQPIAQVILQCKNAVLWGQHSYYL